MEFGQLVSNENQKSKIQYIFFIANDIYRVRHEKSNIAAFQWSTKRFQKEKKFHPECE